MAKKPNKQVKQTVVDHRVKQEKALKTLNIENYVWPEDYTYPRKRLCLEVAERLLIARDEPAVIITSEMNIREVIAKLSRLVK